MKCTKSFLVACFPEYLKVNYAVFIKKSLKISSYITLKIFSKQYLVGVYLSKEKDQHTFHKKSQNF